MIFFFFLSTALSLAIKMIRFQVGEELGPKGQIFLSMPQNDFGGGLELTDVTFICP